MRIHGTRQGFPDAMGRITELENEVHRLKEALFLYHNMADCVVCGNLFPLKSKYGVKLSEGHTVCRDCVDVYWEEIEVFSSEASEVHSEYKAFARWSKQHDVCSQWAQDSEIKALQKKLAL